MQWKDNSCHLNCAIQFLLSSKHLVTDFHQNAFLCNQQCFWDGVYCLNCFLGSYFHYLSASMHSASTVDPTAMMTLFMRFQDAHEYGRTDDLRGMIQTIVDKSNMVCNHLEMLGSFKEFLTYTCTTCNTPHATG